MEDADFTSNKESFFLRQCWCLNWTWYFGCHGKLDSPESWDDDLQWLLTLLSGQGLETNRKMQGEYWISCFSRYHKFSLGLEMGQDLTEESSHQWSGKLCGSCPPLGSTNVYDQFVSLGFWSLTTHAWSIVLLKPPCFTGLENGGQMIRGWSPKRWWGSVNSVHGATYGIHTCQ